MKINKQYLASLIIGAIVGGLTVGVVDVYRPKPLFSSAAPPQCQYLIDNYNQVVVEMNIRPIVDTTRWEALLEQTTEIAAELDSCTLTVCEPIWTTMNDAADQLREWEASFDELVGVRDAFEADNPQPWSDKLNESYQEILEQLFYAEEQVTYFYELREEIEQEMEQMGCNDFINEGLDEIDPLPGDPNSGSGTGDGLY